MAWWRLQRQLFAQEMTEPVMEVLLMGGAQGANLMPPGLDVLVDWDVFNREALEWMRRYLAVDPLPGMGDGQMYTLNQVNEVSRRQTVEEIEFWMREGQALPVLQERLAPIYGKERAKRIAVTEVTRVYSEGNHMAWKASGIVNGLRWMTAKDERVCPICGALNGTIVDISGGWTFTPEMLAQNPELERALRNPQSIRRPPAHVGCVLPGNEVMAPGRIKAATKAFYSGTVVEISLTGGRSFTVTENHPILTPAGWLAAGELTEGGHVVGSDSVHRIAGLVSPDDQHVPTKIEELYATLVERFGVSESVPVAPEDFHGDGRNMSGDIDIVFTDGLLRRDKEALVAEYVGEPQLFGRGMNEGALKSFSTAHLGLKRNGTPLGGLVCGPHLPPPLARRHALPFSSLGLRLAANSHAMFAQVAGECVSANTGFIGESVDRFAGQIALNKRLHVRDCFCLMSDPADMNTQGAQVAVDGLGAYPPIVGEIGDGFPGLIANYQIVKVRKFDFSDHVYNLHVAPHELYFVNGIITHNCRCWLQPVIFEAYDPAELERQKWGNNAG
jgi:SPP1 gp7 family putative phage head morphogenesis protein